MQASAVPKNAHLLRFLGVDVGLILQPLDLCGGRRVRDEPRLACFPGQVRLKQLVSVANALDCLPKFVSQNVHGRG